VKKEPSYARDLPFLSQASVTKPRRWPDLKGSDVYTVQKLGRWKTISMVLRYTHHQPESLRGGRGGPQSIAARK
jgi:hypothetical protein